MVFSARLTQWITLNWRCYLLVPLLVGLDLLSKFWATQMFGGVQTLVPGVLTIRVVTNRGLFFGLGETAYGSSGWIWFVTALASATLFVMAWVTDEKKKMRHIGIACMISGALGNGLDRLIHSHVVDFIQILFLPILNLADLALVMGATLVIADLARIENHL